MELDDTLCYCFHVSKRKVLNYLRIHRPRRASQVSECGGAGTGCGWCIPYLKRYFAQMQQDGAVTADTVTASEYARGRVEHIRAGKGRPPDDAIPDELRTDSKPR